MMMIMSSIDYHYNDDYYADYQLINQLPNHAIHSFIHSFVDDDNDEVGNNKLRRDIVRSPSYGWWGWYVAIDF